VITSLNEFTWNVRGEQSTNILSLDSLLRSIGPYQCSAERLFDPIDTTKERINLSVDLDNLIDSTRIERAVSTRKPTVNVSANKNSLAL
jgi:hypothetical protein